jgi:hypothetical protein
MSLYFKSNLNSEEDKYEYEEEEEDEEENEEEENENEDEEGQNENEHEYQKKDQKKITMTEGIDPTVFYNMNLINFFPSQCEYCTKIFNAKDKLVIILEDNTNMCYHCLFWINYDLTVRKSVDGTYGKTIVEYIIDCKDAHNSSKCVRMGACFLCDNINGLDIDGILCGELVNSNSNSNTNSNDYDVITIDI